MCELFPICVNAHRPNLSHLVQKIKKSDKETKMPMDDYDAAAGSRLGAAKLRCNRTELGQMVKECGVFFLT